MERRSARNAELAGDWQAIGDRTGIAGSEGGPQVGNTEPPKSSSREGELERDTHKYPGPIFVVTVFQRMWYMWEQGNPVGGGAGEAGRLQPFPLKTGAGMWRKVIRSGEYGRGLERHVEQCDRCWDYWWRWLGGFDSFELMVGRMRRCWGYGKRSS